MRFPIGFPLYVPKNGVFGGFDGEDVKIMCSNPQKASVDVSHIKIGSTAWALGRFKDFAYQEIKKKWVVTLAIWGEVTPAAILTKCRMRWDMVDVIMCATFRECWLRGVFVSVLSSRPHCSAHCQPSLVLVSMTSPNGWPQIVWWLILMVRGVSLPSPVELTRRPYNTGHSTVWPCDTSSPFVLLLQCQIAYFVKMGHKLLCSYFP